ncbi:MAG TPA: 2-oxo acid dehydrogenase subunit E2 [Chloroflexota bacterium]|nr:2-oxo acid dehydrogenase subunit E2 [Chloroflexota bacterium]
MATRIIMPKLGMAMKEGTLARWLKQEGESVARDEPIAVVMSKKITYTLTAPADGVLRILTRPQETRVVGATLAFVAAAGEVLPAADDVVEAAPVSAKVGAPPQAGGPEPSPLPAAPAFVLASPAARRVARERGIELSRIKGTGAEGMVTESDVLAFEPGAGTPVEAAAVPERDAEILATSAARRLAGERGVKLSALSGSGVGGRITEQDVLDYAEDREKTAVRPHGLPASRTIPFAGMRRAIAEHMVESLHTMAQLTMQMEVDVTELVKLRGQLKAEFDLTYTDLLVKSVATALKRHPLLNATLIGDEIQLLEQIHVGVAVALEDGLIVPVVRHADSLAVQEIALEMRRLAQGAREGGLSVDEVTGSTFTITNLGSYGIDGFTPIINSPEVAILGVGRIVEKPVIHENEVSRRWLMVLSLTVDHRVVDGAPAAEFLRGLKELIESPYRLLL